MNARKLIKLSLLLFLLVSLLSSCKKDDDVADNGANSSASTNKTINVLGTVVDENGSPLSGVNITFGGLTATSDIKGLFVFKGIVISKERIYIKVSKNGFFPAGRGQIVKNNGTQYIKIMMVPTGIPSILSGTTGGTVSLPSGAFIVFPPNAFVTSTGTLYTGNVRVYAKHIAPGMPDFSKKIPGGDLLAETNMGLTALQTYGMVGAELRDVSGNILQLAGGVKAEIHAPIAASQLLLAPDSIPLLSFDETKGLWMQDGYGHNVGGVYVGSVAHFSWWNFDCYNSTIPLQNLSGRVVDAHGNCVQGILVSVNTYYDIYTDQNGEFSELIYPNFAVTALVDSMFNNGVYSTNTVSCFTSATNNVLPDLVLAGTSFYKGVAVCCNFYNFDLFVEVTSQGCDPNYYYSSGGSFMIPIKSNTNTSMDFSANGANETRSFYSGNVDSVYIADTVFLCPPPINNPSIDIDNNHYSLLAINGEIWFKENLKTTHYNNGDPIPNLTTASAWQNTTSGAYAMYANSTANGAIMGNFYNAITVADPRGLCPIGSHVASEAEWNDLVNFMGNANTAADALKDTGSLYWSGGNAMAIDSLDFSALGAGNRSNIGVDLDIYNSATWWTSNTQSPTSSWYVRINANSSAVSFFGGNVNYGFSVRCVVD